MAKPTFSAAWAAAMRIYDPADSGAKVAQVIGGKVAMNIAPRGAWVNTCAVRISYILNQTGTTIPFIANKTVSGADGRWYFHYVADVIHFLRQSWGKPDIITRYPPAGGGDLAGKKGLILFEISGWGDATGHATLWNGLQCYDHCYFNEPGVNYKTEHANFWALS
ncbi:type VI secretion system amidase effector protein Tae4 [Kosakonia sp. Marseille-Q7440]